MAQRYAQRSEVPVARTREKMQELLGKWGCRKVAFLDDYDAQETQIQFVWIDAEGMAWAALFRISVAENPSLPTKVKREQDVRGRWRTLLYWLRSALDAIDAGVIQAEQVFLPFLVTPTGRTVAEELVPRMRELGPAGLLELGSGASASKERKYAHR